MAYEITRLVHGAARSGQGDQCCNGVFGNSMDLDNVASCKTDRNLLVNGVNIVDLLTLTNFMPSKSEARRVIQQGGLTVNGKKIENAEVIIDLGDVDNGCILFKKGQENLLKGVLVKQI